LVATNLQLDAAGASGSAAANVGSHNSPERFRTSGEDEGVNAIQLVSAQTRVGVAKFFIALRVPLLPRNQTAPQTQRVPSVRIAKVLLQYPHTADQSLFVPTWTRLVWLGPGPFPN
jgi:hypothetical protein